MNFLIPGWREFLTTLFPFLNPIRFHIAPMIIAALAAAGTKGAQAFLEHRQNVSAHNQQRQADARALLDEKKRRARMRAVADHFGVQLPDNIWQLYLNPTGPTPAPGPKFDWLGNAIGAGGAAASAAGSAHAEAQQQAIVDQFLQGRRQNQNPYDQEIDPLKISGQSPFSTRLTRF